MPRGPFWFLSGTLACRRRPLNIKKGLYRTHRFQPAMPHPLEVSVEELEMAWRRLKFDRPHRAFIQHPKLIAWIESDLSSWLQVLQGELADGYSPHSAHLCLVPKPAYMVRPALILDVRDEVVYNLVVGRMYPSIWSNYGLSKVIRT
jgi:hypothetical protein